MPDYVAVARNLFFRSQVNPDKHPELVTEYRNRMLAIPLKAGHPQALLSLQEQILAEIASKFPHGDK